MPAAPDSELLTAPRTAAERGPAPQADPEDIKPGDVLADGRYRIESALGQGGMATVFRARDLQAGREVALKVIAKRYIGRLEREQRFENEGRLAGRLRGHRNIAAPLEVGRLATHGGRMYLAMELARGPTLLDLLSMHGPLPVAEACMYIRDIARALRDLHAGGVVHRDIKPSNVIVVESDRGPVAKLIDFGLAAEIDGRGAAEGDRLTRADERPGTHHYMSPEQAWGAAAHPTFDVYALGVTFYELLVGEPPFHELSTGDVMRRKCDLSLPGPSIAGKRRDLPPGLAPLIDACMAARASDRVATMAAFLTRLDEIRRIAGLVPKRPGEMTGEVGQARTVDAKNRAPRLPQIVAAAAAARAAGRPAPFEVTPIRTGATRPEITADRMGIGARSVGGEPDRSGLAPRVIVGSEGAHDPDATDPSAIPASDPSVMPISDPSAMPASDPSAMPASDPSMMPQAGVTASSDPGAIPIGPHATRGRTEVVPDATRGRTEVAPAAMQPAAARRGGAAALGLTAGVLVGAVALGAWWIGTQRGHDPVAAASDPDRVPPADSPMPDPVAVAGDAAARADDDAAAIAGDAAGLADDDAAGVADADATGSIAEPSSGPAAARADDAVVDPNPASPSNASDDAGPSTSASGSTKADPPPSSKAAPKDDGWTPERCAAERAAADKALTGGRWAGALSHTRINKCWPQDSERQRIRSLAFFELARYDDCINAGAGSSDPVVQRTVRRCQKARDASP